MYKGKRVVLLNLESYRTTFTPKEKRQADVSSLALLAVIQSAQKLASNVRIIFYTVGSLILSGPESFYKCG